jgi:hypothetical protein
MWQGAIKEHWRDWDPKPSSFPYSGSGVPFFADPCFLLQDGKPTYFYGPSDCNVTRGQVQRDLLPETALERSVAGG